MLFKNCFSFLYSSCLGISYNFWLLYFLQNIILLKGWLHTRIVVWFLTVSGFHSHVDLTEMHVPVPRTLNWGTAISIHCQVLKSHSCKFLDMKSRRFYTYLHLVSCISGALSSFYFLPGVYSQIFYYFWWHLK